MLRAVVGLCLAIAQFGILSERFSAGGQHPSGFHPSPATHTLSARPAVTIESDFEIEHGNEAAELLAFELPGEPAVSHLVMGRMDRHTTHLELLLTCGRLLI